MRSALLARHELRLTLREFVALLKAGDRSRSRLLWLALFVVLMHGLALATAGSVATRAPDPPTLALISLSVAFAWCFTASQTVEAVTRVFFARGDLELLLSSPLPATRLFAVRLSAVALGSAGTAVLLAAPFVNVLAALGGPRWLAGYGVALALGPAATAVALCVVVALLHVLRPSQARLIAQVVAAVIGAGFAIALEIVAILSYGSVATREFLLSPAALAGAPGPSSILWWPAHAVMGGLNHLALLLLVSCLLFAAAILAFAQRFEGFVLAIASRDAERSSTRKRRRGFRAASIRQALHRKEWLLLARDPWLVSQALMQILILIPAGLVLWLQLRETNTQLLVVAICVMAAGQLGGGLAWLAVSGEDAPDLLASAPVPGTLVLRAKAESVVAAVFVAFLPLMLALTWSSPVAGAITTVGILVSATSASLVQLWFRAQAKRRLFGRRQTSSRLATVLEAFSAIGWASSFSLVMMSPLLGAISIVFPAGILAIAWHLRPTPSQL